MLSAQGAARVKSKATNILCNDMVTNYSQSLVSVIVPTYNRASLITDSLNSVFLQRYRPIELVVVDDGSTDDTTDILNEWSTNHKQDTWFSIVLLQQTNKGPCAARNLGFKNSHGEFIQFLDSDDTLDPLKIQLQVEALCKSPETDMVYGAVLNMHDASASIYQNSFMSISDSLRCIADNKVGFFCTHSPLFRRHAFEITGLWNENTSCLMDDVELSVRFFFTLPTYSHVPQSISYVRLHQNPDVHIGGIAKMNYPQCVKIHLGILAYMVEHIPKSLQHDLVLFDLMTRSILRSIIRLIKYKADFDAEHAMRVLLQAAQPTTLHRRTQLFSAFSKCLGLKKTAKCYYFVEQIYNRFRHAFKRKPNA